MTLEYLEFDQYEANAVRYPQWKSYRARWVYHARAIFIIQNVCLPTDPKNVLEIGSYGAGLVTGSDRMDLPGGQWPLAGENPTYTHDARLVPWPISDQRYELLIALRVWHHLAPMQEEAFREARRVARNILIVCPEKEVVGQGITRNQFVKWNGGVPPYLEHDLGTWGRLCLWRKNDA